MSNAALTLLPAVDVSGGQAVRMVHGAAGTETGYGDAMRAALAWQAAGARWVHLVDLDAAFGRGSNAELLAAVVGRLDVAVELSGGIRDEVSLAAALATGCARVNIGTAALEDPDWVRDAIAAHGDKIAVGLDVRGSTLSARGWTRDGGELDEALDRLDAAGCARYVVTDINQDGTLTGPNLDLLRHVTGRTSRPVIASGGVSSLDDLGAIATLVDWGWRARSWARRCTPGRSLWRKRWRRWRHDPEDLHRHPVGAGGRVQPRGGGRGLRVRGRLHLGGRRGVRALRRRVRADRAGTAQRGRRAGPARARAWPTWCAPGSTSPTSPGGRSTAGRTAPRSATPCPPRP